MERVHLSLALAVLLVLAGCIGGGGETAPGTSVETTGEATEVAGAETTTATEGTTDGEPLETTAGTENATLPEKDVFEAYGVAVNYSAGGDLDASDVVRSHLRAFEDADRLTVSSVTRTETENYSTVTSMHFERDGTRSLLRTEGAGLNATIYRGENASVMRTVEDGEANYLLLGGANDSRAETDAVTDPAAAVVMELAKLQLLPYEEADTVTWNGTTMTKYEATGPGYYANGGLADEASVESYTSTVLVDEDGLVRLFHQEVVVERDGETVAEAVTVRYDEVGTTTVTEPDWVADAYNRTGETDDTDDDEG